jgi:GT2 family glycosyltransferase
MHRISLVVATKDRPADLRTLLDSLRRQVLGPDEIIVVDASQKSVDSILMDFPELTILYRSHWPPSAAAQRNAGILACDSAATLIGFADDDTTFEPQAFANMRSFWNDASASVLGAAFNLCNYPERGSSPLKHSWLAERIGLYSAKPGMVSRSGWQTMIGKVAETQFVDWLPSSAALFRREVFDQNPFDEIFDSYSYLEDLDLSYTLSRMGRLAVVADAGYCHFSSPHGRLSTRHFGRCEVRNRLYLVRKHHLSLARCYVGLAIRLAMSVASGIAHPYTGQLNRALGNIEEMMKLRAVPVNRVPSRTSTL